MKRLCRLLCFFTALLFLLLPLVLPAHADTGEATLQITDQPAKLILQLGPGWAGTQFELRTDAGVYPGTVVVGENGLLQLELDGSKAYTLSRVQAAPQSSATTTPGNKAAPAETSSATEATEPTTDVVLDDFLAALTEPDTDAPAEQSTQEDDPAPQAVPIKHILVFGGGIIAAVIALIVLSTLKKRRLTDDEEDEYED